MMDEAEFDALLRAELAPPRGPADMRFVTRVDRTILEAERYRASRAVLKRQLATEVVAVGSLAAGLGFVAQIPELREALAAAPGLGWTALLALTLIWLLMTRSRVGTLA